MSSVKPIIRELKQAALKGFAHADHKLHQLTANMDGHLDDVIRQVRGRDHYDGKVDVSVKKFKRNKNHDSAEYTRQYDEQVDTLQRMPLSDWLKNRIEYLEQGRTSDSLRAQQNARDMAENKKIRELFQENGGDLDKATKDAADWMKGQAALHRLDGIAGGNVTDISRVGDTRINSSLGSQWKNRVGDIDQAVIDFMHANPGVDLDNTFINVVLR